MKKRYIAGLLLFVLCFLAGCKGSKTISAGDVDVNTILIRGDGSVQFSIVEEFDKPYYSKDELIDFIDAAIMEYNTVYGEESVVSDSVGIKDGIATSLLTYRNIQDYAVFNDVEAELLTASDALNHEQLPETFVNAADSSSVSKEEALKNSGYKVLFINEALDIMVEGKIKYYSNAIMLKDSMVQTSKEGVTVIVYKP